MIPLYARKGADVPQELPQDLLDEVRKSLSQAPKPNDNQPLQSLSDYFKGLSREEREEILDAILNTPPPSKVNNYVPLSQQNPGRKVQLPFLLNIRDEIGSTPTTGEKMAESFIKVLSQLQQLVDNGRKVSPELIDFVKQEIEKHSGKPLERSYRSASLIPSPGYHTAMGGIQ